MKLVYLRSKDDHPLTQLTLQLLDVLQLLLSFLKDLLQRLRLLLGCLLLDDDLARAEH